jgi:hypothetical protein
MRPDTDVRALVLSPGDGRHPDASYQTESIRRSAVAGADRRLGTSWDPSTLRFGACISRNASAQLSRRRRSDAWLSTRPAPAPANASSVANSVVTRGRGGTSKDNRPDSAAAPMSLSDCERPSPCRHVSSDLPCALSRRQPPARLLAMIALNIATSGSGLIGSPCRNDTVRAVLFSWPAVMIPSGSGTMRRHRETR